MKRIKHWDTKGLGPFLKARAATPFQWGVHDCALFAADAVRSATGVDIASEFRGKYHDEASATALIKRLTGGETVADAAAYCAQRHGLAEHSHALKAQRGDLVVIANGGRMIAGIVHLNGRHVIALAESGPVRLRLLDVVKAWSY